MARSRTTKANCLNIAGERLDPSNYVKAFSVANQLKQIISGRSSRQYTVKVSKSDPSEVKGVVFRFTDFDRSLKWFNRETMEQAKPSEESKIVIPSELRPNLQQFYFLFDVSSHKLFFESKSSTSTFGVKEAADVFSAYLNHPDVRSECGYFSVNVVTDSEKFKDIFDSLKVKHIEIRIDRPNPDDFGAEEQKFQSRLAAMNVRTYKEVYDAAPGTQINYDEELAMKASFASVNGEITARGRDPQNNSVKVSSESYPVTGIYQHSDDAGTEWSAFEYAIKSLPQNKKNEDS